MLRIEVCFLILILVSVVLCQNATNTATSAAGASTTLTSPAAQTTTTTTTTPTTTTTTTTEKPDMVQDAVGKILKVPEDIFGAFVDIYSAGAESMHGEECKQCLGFDPGLAGSVFGIFKPK